VSLGLGGKPNMTPSFLTSITECMMLQDQIGDGASWRVNIVSLIEIFFEVFKKKWQECLDVTGVN
jgi:hypothetical protein